MLKTMIGRSLSMQSEIAEASITFSCFSSTSRKLMLSNFVAVCVLNGIRRVDAVDLGRLHYHVSLDLECPQGRR